jgi:subtilisin family serine protease
MGPRSTPTPPPPPPPGVLAACTTAGAPQSAGRQTLSAGSRSPEVLRGHPVRGTASAQGYVPGELAVTFDRARYLQDRSQMRSSLSAARAQAGTQFDFAAIGKVTQIVRVDPSQVDAATAQLKSAPGVQSVDRVAYRHLMSSNASAAFTNDPYYRGFAPANVPPFYESASLPGQWDMHVTCAANAWAYANASSNSLGIHANATGTGIKIAIIDTGADVTHPELKNKIVYAETDVNGVVTQNDPSMHDNDGHGTDVAGIAAGENGNGVGFASTGYNAQLMIFRVFADPPAAGCPPKSTDPLCSASTPDIATAIQDAVSKGARVISLSLGGSKDTTEENAVANAIAAGVVVVAASGNETATTLDYPAADPGVIAVGASAIDDSNASAPVEKVASYSNYDAANPTAWGVVAPGGDPVANDPDDLHWIENIDSSTDKSFATCAADYGNPTGPTDCRALFAGTSQATPHVAGAAALLLGAGVPAANVKNVLCATAQRLTDPKAGCGRLNVYRAMANAVGDPNP